MSYRPPKMAALTKNMNMEKLNLRSMYQVLLTVMLILSGQSTQGAVTVTPVNNGTCLPVSPAGYVVLSNIRVTEGSVNDIAAGAGVTFILTAPTGFEFRPGFGYVTYTSGMDITSATLAVTATTITVTLNVATTANMDAIRIRNVQARALSYGVFGAIERTLAGGTAVITGDAPGAGISHGWLTATGTGGAINSLADGNWSDPSIWSTGTVPSCSDLVTINHNVTADMNATIGNLTINGSALLITNSAINVTGTFTISAGGTYQHNNTTTASTSIFNGTENFDTNSKIIIDQWSSGSIPLATGVNGNFGEIEINYSGSWHQKGAFAPDRIKNTLTINDGLFILDNGTGMTTALTLEDVIITNNGRIQVQTGTPRDLTLVTGNFADMSYSSDLSSITYRSVGNLNWTVNGDLQLSHRFSIQEGQNVGDAGSLSVTVNGNFFLIGSIFDGMKKINGPMTMSVTDSIHIMGSASVRFKDYYTGNLTVTADNFFLDNTPSVYALGTNHTSGEASINVNNSMILSGNTSRLYVADNSANTSDVSLMVLGNLLISDAQLYTATTSGIVDVYVGGDYSQTGATSEFYGQRHTAGNYTTTLTVSGSMNVLGGMFMQSRNLGDVVANVIESVNIQNCTYYGMNNLAVGNNGLASLDCADLIITGSSFFLHRGYITDGRTIDVNISGEMSIEFTDASQQVMFVGRGSDNNAKLDLQIGTNMTVFGSADGLFCSSISAGDETISIGGDMTIYAGKVRFNSYEDITARGHDVTGTISGSLILSGGSICLSSNRGATTWDIMSDYDQSGGYAVYKWYNQGGTTINVQGNYSLNNGNVIFHSRALSATSDPVQVTVNGNGDFANSTVVFDSCAASSAIHKLILQGAQVTYGTNSVFKHEAYGTTNTNLAEIHYDRAGALRLMRTASSFDIMHTRQMVTAGTTVDFTASSFDLMVSSHPSSAAATHTTLSINGALNMGTFMVVGREATGYYASVEVNDGGVLRTGHVNGLYSGAATPSCIYPIIAGNYRMNYFLHLNSKVVYNGIDTQKLTGTGLGIATTSDHRYGYIEIDFNGTPDVEFVNLTGDSAQIRNGLILTNGELNLNTDHNSNGVGHTIHLLNGATITRTNGYMRSETYDGSAQATWMINSNGTYVIPFGRSSTEYIPLTFQKTAGGAAGNSYFATNRVANDNTPYPPTVTHVNDVNGINNSTNTVDRFWKISVSGSPTATITFTATASELTGITSPRAQLWEPVSTGWFPPAPSQSNPTATTTQISGVTSFNNWWTLSSAANPLPVELLSFEARPAGSVVQLNWVTASELNNDYFSVERSRNGIEFTEIIQVDGAGTSSQVHSYTTVDANPYTGVSYYRLRQTDFDGQTSYSQIRKVSMNKDLPVTIYPNPVISNVINIATTTESEEVNTVTIYDVTGKIVEYHNRTSSTETPLQVINLGQKIHQGTYLVEVTTTAGVYRERIIKQ